MTPLVHADWTAIAALAAISLAEGLRKVPEGSVVLRALGLSEWDVVNDNRKESGLRLVSMWAPFTRHLVLSPRTADGPAPDRTELERRLAAVQPLLPALEATGALALVALVLGVPVASRTFGGVGFLASLAFVMATVAASVMLAMRALGRIGYAGRQAWARAHGLVSPFAASQGSERVLEAVFEDAAPVQAARLLLAPEAFREWIRPAVYDVQRGGEDRWGVRELLDEEERAHALETAPFDGPVCPRCGRAFRAGVAACPDCGGVALTGGMPMSRSR